MGYNSLRFYPILMKLVPLESPESPLSNGTNFIKIRCDLKELLVIEIRPLNRPIQFLNFSTVLESGISFTAPL